MKARIRRGGPSAERARIDEYLTRGEAWSLHTDGMERWLHREFRKGERYEVERYSLSADAARCVDRTVFQLSDERFVEAERYESADGPNLHARPIALPAVLAVGASHHPLGRGARVALLHAGPTRFAIGDHAEVIDAIAIIGEQGDAIDVQWLARGIGVIALGPLGHAPRSWRIGHLGEAQWPWALDPALLTLERLPLP